MRSARGLIKIARAADFARTAVWLRSRLDRPSGDRFVVSGSNAHLLSGELGSTLTGRHLVIELFPFSFDEARRAMVDRGADLDVVMIAPKAVAGWVLVMLKVNLKGPPT